MIDGSGIPKEKLVRPAKVAGKSGATVGITLKMFATPKPLPDERAASYVEPAAIAHART